MRPIVPQPTDQSNADPMILPIHDTAARASRDAPARALRLAASDQPALAIEYPPTRALGDLALPVAFELARRLRKAPRSIAQELAGALTEVEGVARVESDAERLPELSFSIARRFCGRDSIRAAPAARPAADAGKTIVEHTAINPNKAAHIGHLRNSALGDTLVRVLRFRGVPVEVQNYIDDTGVQVADVVVGFRELEQQVARRGASASPTRRGSTTTAGTCTPASPSGTRRTRRGSRSAPQTLHDIEHGGNATAEMAAFIADAHRPRASRDDGAARTSTTTC